MSSGLLASLAGLMCLAVQAGTAHAQSALPGRPGPSAPPTGAATTAERQAFMVSLVATPEGTHSVALHWKAEPGATGYQVLRAAVLRGPYVNITPGDLRSTSVVTRGLPGSAMVFRVVALHADHARDTTSAAYAVIKAPARPGILRIRDCHAQAPSTLHVAWDRDPDADLYTVQIYNDTPPAPRALVDVHTHDTSFSQSGLPAGHTLVRVTSVYALPDFPAAGDTTLYTRNTATVEAGAVTFPVSKPEPCK